MLVWVIDAVCTEAGTPWDLYWRICAATRNLGDGSAPLTWGRDPGGGAWTEGAAGYIESIGYAF